MAGLLGTAQSGTVVGRPRPTKDEVFQYMAANNFSLDPKGLAAALKKQNQDVTDKRNALTVADVGAAFDMSPEQSAEWMQGEWITGGGSTEKARLQREAQQANGGGLIAAQTQQSAPLSPVQPVSAPQIQAAPSAVQAQAQQITVDPTKTSQGLYEQYSAKDSLAKQLAETASMERANSRGLLNSSMAVGEAQKARDVVDLTSATTDSGIYANAAQTNAQLGTQTSIANMNDAGSTQRARIQEAGAGARQAQQLTSQQQLAELDAQVRKDISRENNAQSMAVAQLNAATQENINRLDTASREKISQATIEANNLISNRQIDASERGNFQNATTNAMGNYANAISKIDLDTNLDAESKAAARNAAEVVMRNSMTAAAAVAGVEGISQLWAAE